MTLDQKSVQLGMWLPSGLYSPPSLLQNSLHPLGQVTRWEKTPSSCARGGSDHIFREKFVPEGVVKHWKGSGGVPTPGIVQKPRECGTWGHGLVVTVVVLGLRGIFQLQFHDCVLGLLLLSEPWGSWSWDFIESQPGTSVFRIFCSAVNP